MEYGEDAQVSKFLEEANAIFSQQVPGIYGMQLSELTYTICNTPSTPRHELLFVAIGDFLCKHAEKVVSKLQVHRVNTAEFVKDFVQEWFDYYSSANALNSCCLYLNKTLNMRYRLDDEIPDISEMSNVCDELVQGKYRRQTVVNLAFFVWSQIVYKKFGSFLVEIVRNYLNTERISLGSDIQPLYDFSSYVSSITLMEAWSPDSFATYQSEYEQVLLNETCEYYSQLGSEDLNQLTVSAHMKKAKLLYSKEEERVLRYFHDTSYTLLLSSVVDEYITPNASAITIEFAELLKKENSEELTLAYELMMLTKLKSKTLAPVYENFVYQNCLQIPLDGSTPEMVETYTKFCAKRNLELTDYFHKDQSMSKAMNQGVRRGINRDPIRAAECMAVHFDNLLRSQETVNASNTHDAYAMLSFVDEVDAFQKYYTRYLARRLIHSPLYISDGELWMAERLRPVCGGAYTGHLLRMFRDVELSKSLMESFRQSLRPGQPGGELVPMVLASSSWTMLRPKFAHAAALPAQITSAWEAFRAYYIAEHSGRKLDVLWNLCRIDIRFSASRQRVYEMNASLLQAAVLLALDDLDAGDGFHSVAEIAAKTSVELVECRDTIRTLAAVGVLIFDNVNDSAAVNSSYAGRQHKFRLPASATGLPSDGVAPLLLASGEASPPLPPPLLLLPPPPNSEADDQQQGPHGGESRADGGSYLPNPDDSAGGQCAGGGAQARECDFSTDAAPVISLASLEAERVVLLQTLVMKSLKAQRVMTVSEIFETASATCANRFRLTLELLRKTLDTLVTRGFVRPLLAGEQGSTATTALLEKQTENPAPPSLRSRNGNDTNSIHTRQSHASVQASTVQRVSNFSMPMSTIVPDAYEYIV